MIVVGLQWGDEGKGKVVDWLAESADIVVRFQGGQNAGHTIVVGDETFTLSLLPSGILRHGTVAVLGSGVVIDPESLIHEIRHLRDRGFRVDNTNFMIAENASLVLGAHKHLDIFREGPSDSKSEIGTTLMGIGPAYEDKVGRRAVRVCDMANPDRLDTVVKGLVRHHNKIRQGYNGLDIQAKSVHGDLLDYAPHLLPFVRPVWKFLRESLHQNKTVLFEGAQGTFLDVEHGTYPYVTSSSTVSGSALCGSGVGPKDIESVVGVCKAYQTRVGNGPFPTEQLNSTGGKLRRVGVEIGTITSRPRRCGWLDAVMVRQACAISGVEGVVITKLDVLDGFDELKVCSGYRLMGQYLDHLPSCTDAQSKVVPLYETFPGWTQPTAGVRKKSNLPKEARAYIDRIEELIECPVTLLSTSPERNDIIRYSDGPPS